MLTVKQLLAHQDNIAVVAQVSIISIYYYAPTVGSNTARNFIAAVFTLLLI